MLSEPVFHYANNSLPLVLSFKTSMHLLRPYGLLYVVLNIQYNCLCLASVVMSLFCPYIIARCLY